MVQGAADVGVHPGDEGGSTTVSAASMATMGTVTAPGAHGPKRGRGHATRDGSTVPTSDGTLGSSVPTGPPVTTAGTMAVATASLHRASRTRRTPAATATPASATK